MEVTALCIRLLVNGLLLLTAQTLNRHFVHKADAAFLHIHPNRQQFLEYDHISLRCEGFHGSTDWIVMRNIPSGAGRWETSAELLDIKPAFTSHSGEYWCENGDGDRSNTVNITVTAGDVILESPALPVMETQNVSLRCRKRATSNSSADFYKDGLISRTGYTGEIIIHNVSKSDEGLYKCAISGAQSPESWLAVREYITPAPEATTAQTSPEASPHPQSSPDSDQLSVQLSVVFTILSVAALLLVVGLLQCRKRRVACFSSEMPTGGSGPEFVPANEHASVADPHMSTYANAPRHKKKKAFEHVSVADPDTAVYANVPNRKKKRVRREEILPAPKETYAAVKKKKRVSGGTNVTEEQTEEGERSLRAATPD